MTAPDPPGSAAVAGAAGSSIRADVVAYEAGAIESRSDLVAAEEPLEMRVSVEEVGRRAAHSVAVTMRTPGHDFPLAAGFFFTEGIVAGREAIAAITYCREVAADAEGNVVDVALAPGVPFDPARFSRNVYTTSSCGVCGKTSIDLVRTVCPAPPVGDEPLAPAMLTGLPETLGRAQPVFSRTGGLHAAGLFDAAGRLLLLREDVGRHNAVDKVVGTLLLDGALPASHRVLVVSGRASFELVQKALAAGIPTLAAVGAPSSLAVELAREFGLTLIGFLRDGRFNVYAGEERIG